MVNFSLPVFANVDLIHLPVHDALANRFHVGFVCFIGMSHRFSMRLRCRYIDGRTVPPNYLFSRCTPCFVVAKHAGGFLLMVNDHSTVNQPQHGEYRSLARRVLEAKRLGPLDEVVGQRS